MMRYDLTKRVAAVFGAMACAASAWAMSPLDYTFLRVSPDGDDAAAGTAAAPLRTFSGAQARIRAMKAKDGGLKRSVIVEFADGEYAVGSPVSFTAADSGTCEHTIVYRALNRGKAVVTGGGKLKWTVPPAADPLLRRIPAAVRGRIRVATVPGTNPLPGFAGGRCFENACPLWLFAEDRRLPVAGWPDKQEDLLRLGESYDIIPARNDDADLARRNDADKVRVAFACDAPNLAAWVGEPDPWAFGFWGIEWDDAISPFTVDPQRRELSLVRKSICYPPQAGSGYRVLNCFSELDRPGEWAIDRVARRVYLLPDGETLPTAAVADKLLVAHGLSDVTFDGFTFELSRDVAVDLADCRSVVVRGCTVRKTVSWGVSVVRGSDCRVEGCDLYRLGEGGIALAGGDRATLTPCRHAAVNNHIHDYGEVLASYRAGISLGRLSDVRQAPTVGCRVEHNLIHHAPHQGIAFYGSAHSIGYNVVHDTCLWTADAGPLYGYTESDWTDCRGTVIERNVVAMNGRKRYPKMVYDIYVDGIQSGVTVRDNLTVGGTIGIFSQGGHANVQERNLVVLARKPQVRNDLGGRINHTKPDSTACRNLLRYRDLYESGLWRDLQPDVARMLAIEDRSQMQHAHFTIVRDNLYVASGAPENQNLPALAATSVFTNNLSVKEDPGFVDWAGLDWRLKPDSLAYRQLGPNRFEEAGLFADGCRASPPCKFGAGFAVPREIKASGKTMWDPPEARIDVVFEGDWSVDRPCATGLVGCKLPDWAAGKRLVTGWGTVKHDGRWSEYAFSFVPNADGAVHLTLMGANGEKTYYDDVRVTGAASAVDGDFEGDGVWKPSRVEVLDVRNDVSDPIGVSAAPAGLSGKPGNRVGIANHARMLTQSVKVRKGERVTVTFKAAGLVR